MLVIRTSAVDLRQGWTRRDCLRVGFGGAIGLVSANACDTTFGEQPALKRSFGRAKSCILIYLFGGPSHIDIWDMKPDAPAEIRGEFRPQATIVPGIEITEHLPRLARMANHYAIIRSLTHGDSAHGSAGHIMLTGRRPRSAGEIPPTSDDFPHFGSVLAQLRPTDRGVIPSVLLPQIITTSTNLVPGQNAGFLGRALDPYRLETLDDDNRGFGLPLTQLPAEMTLERLEKRQSLLERLERYDHKAPNPTFREMGKLYDQAFDFIYSPASAHAFRLDQEPESVRERYGKNVFGQSLLLARRLVEAGVRMVTVCWPDRQEPEAFINNGVRDPTPVPTWDTHGKRVGNTPNFPTLRNVALPPLDLASSALLEDLQARGMLDETLLIWTGEFGRSPRINGDAGRDHYGNVFSAMLAGGGIRGGQVYGASDRLGAFPAQNPVSPGDFAATLYHCLGVRPQSTIHDRLGRAIPLTDGQVIEALV